MFKKHDLFWTPSSQNKGPAFISEKNLVKKKYHKPDRLIEKPDAIVIGSGIGGLSFASIYAQKQKKKVLVLEANSVPGGCMHCHEMGGFEFNTGIDSIGDMDPRIGRGLYRPSVDYITGGKLSWAKMPEVHEVCCLGDETFDFYSSTKRNIEWVERLFPGQGDIRKYYRMEKEIEASAWAFAVTTLLPLQIPEALREGFYDKLGGKWRKYMFRNTADVFRHELGFSQKLSAVFSYMYGNHGTTPQYSPFAFHAVNLFHYRDGAYYPVGGPAQITECIIPIIEAAGGQVAVSSPVKQIMIEGGKAIGVELETGEMIEAPLVVSDASAYTTWMDLVDRDITDSIGYTDKLEKARPSPAHLYLFLGYDGAIDLPKQIYWHMPTYEGIDQYDLDRADESYKREMRFDGMGGYLLSPSARDPVYAERYPNKTTALVLAEAPHAWVERSKKDAAFRKKVEKEVRDNLMKIVHRHMPQLRDKNPAFEICGLPTGCNPRAYLGSSYGLAGTASRFTYDAHWLRPSTPIKNLFLVGQDAFTMGFCGSMLSGRMTYAAITGNLPGMLKKRP